MCYDVRYRMHFTLSDVIIAQTSLNNTFNTFNICMRRMPANPIANVYSFFFVCACVCVCVRGASVAVCAQKKKTHFILLLYTRIHVILCGFMYEPSIAARVTYIANQLLLLYLYGAYPLYYIFYEYNILLFHF